MKRIALRDLRSVLLKAQAWSIYEPSLGPVLELLGGDTALTPKQINVRLGLGRVPSSRFQVPSSPLAADASSSIKLVGTVAVLPICGLLMQRESWLTKALGWTATETLERDFKAALANEQVQAIVLYCDSPGGVALGIEEVSAAIFAGRKQKPLHTFVRGLCASAAYYLGSAANRLTATPSSTVGSIGTIYTHVEYAAALKEMGIGVTVIKHGERKGDGNPYEKLSPAAHGALQKWVDAYGDQFDAAVARNRGVAVADVRSKFGQGQAFLASEALDRGLIDAVGTWEQLLAGLKQSAAPLPALPVRSGPPSQQPGQTLPLLDVAGLAAGSAVFSNPLCVDGSPLSVVGSPLFGGGGHGGPRTTDHGPVANSSVGTASMKISARVRAALFARGLIAAQDADEGICLAALAAYFAARGEACPQDDDKIVAALFAAAPAAGEGARGRGGEGANAPALPLSHSPTPNVAAAHEREMQEARTAAATSERQRQSAIRASAELLGMSADAVTAAIDGGQSHETVIAGWHQQLAARERPVASGANVRVGQDGHERYMQDALTATLIHFGQPAPAGTQVTADIERLSHAPLLVHAEKCLAAAGIRFDPYDREATAQAALAMDGYERSGLRAEGVFNRPMNFPNLLSALANKLFDEGVEAADVSYTGYAARWPGDLPDFKPAPVVSRSGYSTLDEVLDAEEFKEQGLSEECLSYMALSRFGNSVKLTPVLLANDDLGAFMDELSGLAEAWELTKNRGCLNLVTGNVTLLDTYQLYDGTNHGNVITTPGNAGPSVTSWDYMQQKMAAQTTVGATAYSRARLEVVLVPPKHEVAAQQTFLPLQGTIITETKNPATDATINVFRGKVKVLFEPELAASSADVWYGFASPKRFRNATIVIAYFRGYGQAGRRERWYDPTTKCWHVSLEGRAGFAAKNYRTTVRNPGV